MALYLREIKPALGNAISNKELSIILEDELARIVEAAIPSTSI